MLNIGPTRSIFEFALSRNIDQPWRHCDFIHMVNRIKAPDNPTAIFLVRNRIAGHNAEGAVFAFELHENDCDRRIGRIDPKDGAFDGPANYGFNTSPLPLRMGKADDGLIHWLAL